MARGSRGRGRARPDRDRGRSRAWRQPRAARGNARPARRCNRRTDRPARGADAGGPRRSRPGGASSDAELREGARVFVGERLPLKLGQEAIVVPDVERVDLAQHIDVAAYHRRVAEARGYEHAPLGVELGDLAKVVDAIEIAQSGWVC